MKRLTDDEKEKIEQFMEDEVFDSIDYMLECFKRLRGFAQNTYDELCQLDNKGDLE